MIRLNATALYAIARTTALAQLDCSPAAANRIAQTVQGGVPYATVVAQYRARQTQAAQQQASGNSSNDEQVDEDSDDNDRD